MHPQLCTTRPLRSRRIRRGERGFTLIEVLVASVVFLIGMTGVFALESHLVHQTAQANYMSLASNLATSGIEELRMNRFQDVVGSSDCSECDPILPCDFDASGAELTTPDGLFFKRTWSAQTDAVNGVTDVTVTVRWPDFKRLLVNSERSVAMRGRVMQR